MFSVKVVSKISEIEADWKRMYSEGMFTYCQNYDFFKEIFFFCQKNFIKKLFWGKCIFYKVFEDDKCIFIAPILKKGKKGYFLGYKAPVNYTLTMYDTYTDIGGGVKFLLEYLASLGFSKIQLGFCPFKQMQSFVKCLDFLPFTVKKTETFNVELNYDFNSSEDYFKSLSKSVRQNYRTAINRIVKDGKTWEIRYYEDEIPYDMVFKFLKTHKKRMKYRYGNGRPKVLEALSGFYRFFIYGKWRFDEPVKNLMLQGRNQILSVLMIDDEPAAFYYGRINEQNGFERINFWRVCADTIVFGRYSPGLILGIRFIEKYGRRFSIYDFTCGGEDYKYQLGCSNEVGYKYTIEL